MNEYIYILRESNKRSKNYFKIGKGCDSKRKYDAGRYRHIQIGNPRKLYLIEKIYDANADKLEPFFHKNLMEFHYRGEWFYLNEELFLNKIKEIKNSFKNLNSTEIKKIKSPLKFLSNNEQAKLLGQKSATKRRQYAINWAKEVNLFGLIQEAIDTLENPNLKNVAKFLNNKGVKTRSGHCFSGSNLHKQLTRFNEVNLRQQINRLGVNWKELKNQHK
jgi:hypothetical protein